MTDKIGLTIEEAADYTGIGRNTMRKLVEWEKIPVLRIGRRYIIRIDVILLTVFTSTPFCRAIVAKVWRRSWKLPPPAAPLLTAQKRRENAHGLRP